MGRTPGWRSGTVTTEDQGLSAVTVGFQGVLAGSLWRSPQSTGFGPVAVHGGASLRSDFVAVPWRHDKPRSGLGFAIAEWFS